MEDTMSRDRNTLVDVLTHGEELARQLESHLDEHTPSEFCKSLARKIQSALRTAIPMAKSVDPEGSRHPACPNNTGSDSPPSASDSPRSENSDRPFKDSERREAPKKRKAAPKWTSRVRVSSEAGTEGTLDDGYSWRKYGQKDILGAKYPRGYYRCSHRKAHECVAKKQVQRTDEDPSIFDVTYQGSHTCRLQAPRLAPMQQNPDQHQQGFGSGPEVKAEGLQPDPTPSSFAFPSTLVSYMNPEELPFSSPSTLENQLSFSPPFVSTADSAYFSMSPGQFSSYPAGPNLHGAESELPDIVSAVNSPIMDMDFVLGPGELDAGFPFDASNFFS